MKKRTVCILVTALMILPLTACAGKENGKTETAAVTEQSTEAKTETVTEQSTEAKTEAVTEQSTEAKTEAVTEQSTEAKTEAVTEQSTEAESVTATEQNTDEESNRFDTLLDTEDLYGNFVNEDLVKDAGLVMLNFWEPWCGPCVSEMPDLQKLYETYKDGGLVIVGVYSTFSEQDEAETIVEENGIGYPILKCNEELQKMETSYVPTTYFLDGEGNVLTDEPYIGAKSYEDWEKIVKEYLGE